MCIRDSGKNETARSALSVTAEVAEARNESRQRFPLAGFGRSTTADTNATRGAGRLVYGERLILARFGGGIAGGIGGAKGLNETTELKIVPASKKANTFKTDEPARQGLKRFYGFPK